jgi:hypothetical protein
MILIPKWNERPGKKDWGSPKKGKKEKDLSILMCKKGRRFLLILIKLD